MSRARSAAPSSLDPISGLPDRGRFVQLLAAMPQPARQDAIGALLLIGFDHFAEATNTLDAMCQGASDGMKLTINVLAMLIGFTAVIALANYLLVLPQDWAGVAEPITFDKLLVWLNAPFAWLMGVPWSDCPFIGECLGKRIVFTEFIGYDNLKAAIPQGGAPPVIELATPKRSIAIATFAICGFANFASIAIQIGGIGSLAPERRKDLASLGLRAMAGGILVGYTNACIAGLFI